MHKTMGTPLIMMINSAAVAMVAFLRSSNDEWIWMSMPKENIDWSKAATGLSYCSTEKHRPGLVNSQDQPVTRTSQWPESVNDQNQSITRTSQWPVNGHDQSMAMTSPWPGPVNDHSMPWTSQWPEPVNDLDQSMTRTRQWPGPVNCMMSGLVGYCLCYSKMMFVLAR